MESKPEDPKDQNYISVGFRIPKYLMDFVSQYENKEKKVTRSDVFRTFLEILYHQPHLIDQYQQGRPITTNLQEEIESKIDLLNDKYELHQKIIEQLNQRTKLIEGVTEKLLGISFDRILGAPDHILDQLYAKLVDESKS